MNTNHLGIEERLAAGKRHEEAAMYELQRMFWSVIPATDEQDKVDKIDCWVRWKGVSYSVAIKYRESGTDLGLALVRPYVDHPTFELQWRNLQVPFDRDFQHIADLYAVALPDGLQIVTGISVLKTCNEALRTHAVSAKRSGEGWELKVVKDLGANGYSSGQKKLIAYIDIDALERIEV